MCVGNDTALFRKDRSGVRQGCHAARPPRRHTVPPSAKNTLRLTAQLLFRLRGSLCACSRALRASYLFSRQATPGGVAASSIPLASPLRGKARSFRCGSFSPPDPLALGSGGVHGSCPAWQVLLIQQAGNAGQLLALQKLQGGAPQRSSAPLGTPLDLISSGGMNPPCGKVCSANAWTRLRRGSLPLARRLAF